MRSKVWPNPDTTPPYRLQGEENGKPYQYFLTETGNGLGNFNFNGDYSGTPKTIYLEPTKRYDIHLIMVVIICDSKIYQVNYGNISGVTVGPKFYVRPAGAHRISDLR